jgi:putative membrane protein
MQERKIKDYFVIMLKGLAMGAADVVPGVSGGTIAFISGIYEELLTSISSVSFKSLKILKSEGVKSFWKAINGNFLISLVVGIGISILSLVKLISWLLDTKPILVWSFFFGLVLASILYIGKQIVQWKFLTFFLLVLSAFIAYWITTLEPLVSAETSPIYLLFAGALAICAMILPGISGAFILVLLGAYKSVLEAVDNKDIKLIAIIGAGAIVGLLTFSRILKWLFAHYKNMTLAILTGFVLGSLNKIWPWKETLTWRMNSHGLQVPVNEQSVSPFTFEGDPQLLYAIILATIGFFSILFLEKMAGKNE